MSAENAFERSDNRSPIARIEELERYPWLLDRQLVAEPPAEVARFVVLFPVLGVPNQDFFPALSVSDIVENLSTRGIAVATVGLRPTVDLRDVFSIIKNADAICIFMFSTDEESGDDRPSVWITNLLNIIVQFARSTGVARLYGVLFGRISIPDYEFSELIQEPGVDSPEQMERVAAELANYYIAQTAGATAQRVAKKERQERIERNAAEYIEDAIAALRGREERWKRIAHTCHVAGFVTLVSGIGAVLYFSTYALDAVKAGIQWPLVVYLGLKSVIIVGLLVAASKYAFTIGRSYMNEALKNADRIHAINFGTFYLKAYGDSATWDQLKEVLQHWNIARDSGFAGLDSTQFDPQLLTAAIEIVKSLSPVGFMGSK